MSHRRVTFVLLYDDFNELKGGFNDYNSDFKNELNLEEEEELKLIEDILLFKDNNINSESNNSSFIDINKYF
jgi:hypothetical protein